MRKGQTVTANVSRTDADDIQKEVTLAYLETRYPLKIYQREQVQLVLKFIRNKSWIYFMATNMGAVNHIRSCYFGIVRGKLKKNPHM